jgi:hypothetical protein
MGVKKWPDIKTAENKLNKKEIKTTNNRVSKIPTIFPKI